MAHKCVKPGCAFFLPDTYPYPLCPWHAAPGKGKGKIVVVAGAAAVLGGAYVWDKLRRKKKTQAEQEAWRKRGEEMKQTEGTNEGEKKTA